MTLSNESRKSQLFTGSGSTGPFPFTFKVFAKEDLVVTTSVIATGVETPLSLDTDYTVLLNKDQDGNPGGSVTLKNGVGEHGPLPTTKRLLISGGMALTQPQEIGNQDGFFAEDIENALDRAMIAAQQLKVDVDRAFKLPLTSGYTDPNVFIEDLLETDQSAQEAKVAAEAAQAAAEADAALAQTARIAAELAESNAESYVNNVDAATSTVYATYVAAKAALDPPGGPAAPSGTVFRVKDGGLYYVYTWYSSGHGVLEYITPVDGIASTAASAASGGVTSAGLTIPANPVMDVVGIDSSYNHNQIRNRAVGRNPDLNLLGNTKPSKNPLRTTITSAVAPAGTGDLLFGSVLGELVVSHTPTSGTDTMTVSVANIVIPPGRWTVAFDHKAIGTDANFRWRLGSGSYAAETALAAGFSTASKTDVDVTTETTMSLEFFREESGTTTSVQIVYDNLRLIPGSSATYTEPAERHGWHRRSWSIDEGRFVPENDDKTTDKLHFQVPFSATKQFEEATLSVAIKPTSNSSYQVASVTAPASQPFTVLAVPSVEIFRDETFVPSPLVLPYDFPTITGGYLGFNSLGSTDIAVQVRGIAPPKDRFSILTIVFPKEQGLASSPTRIYLNGILLQSVEEVIPVKTTNRTNDSNNLRFNFGKAHNFVEDQPVTVTKSGVGSAFPTGIDDLTTYYVRLPATNPQEGLYLSLTEGGTPIQYGVNPGSGNIFVRSQKRPVGTVPFSIDMLSLLGFGDIESLPFNTGRDAFGAFVTSTTGSNMEGDFGSAVLYDKALTDAEVQNLVAVQKQRIASHYEQVASLGSVLLTEGDSITFGIGTEGPTETFRFRLFYGLDFNKHTASSITAEDAEQTFTATDGTPELVIDAPGHQFQNGNAVQFTTDNTLPGGLTAGVTHYVINRTDNTFEVSLTSGGPAISYVNAGTGPHQVKFVTNKLLLTFPSAHGYDTGDAIQISSTNTLPTGLTEDTIYYVQKRSNTTMFLSEASLVTSPAVVYTDAGIGDATIRAFVPALDDDAEKLNVVSFATSGSVIGDTLARRDSLVETIEKVVAEGSRPIVVYMTGVNDLILGVPDASTPDPNDRRPLNAADIELLGLALQNIWTSYRNAGAKVIACTITAAEVGNPASGFYSEALRTQLNDKIRSLSAYYDALADFGATQQVGTWQDPNDPPGNPNSYFADHVHPRLQGHIVMANILSPLIDSFRL